MESNFFRHSASLSSNQIDNVPGRPGIYAITKSEDRFGLYLGTSVLYVGQSKNLKARVNSYTNPRRCHNTKLKEHLRLNCNKNEIVTFHYREWPKTDLSVAEINAITLFKPLYNIQHNGAK